MEMFNKLWNQDPKIQALGTEYVHSETLVGFVAVP